MTFITEADLGQKTQKQLIAILNERGYYVTANEAKKLKNATLRSMVRESQPVEEQVHPEQEAQEHPEIESQETPEVEPALASELEVIVTECEQALNINSKPSCSKPSDSRQPRIKKMLHIAPKPMKEIKPVKHGSKHHMLISHLESGATLEDMASATGWKPASVRSALSYDVHSIKGYGVKQDHDLFYLVMPEGLITPVIV